MTAHVVEFGKDGRRVEPDGRLDAAAFHRNHAPIGAVLARFLRDRSGDVVEVGSGTGQHVIAFARAHPDIVWWPSDPNPRHLKSIDAWRAHAALGNVRAPMPIDLSDPDWYLATHHGSGPADIVAVVCANVIHIAPWRVAEGLFAGAARCLRPDGRLYLYGPFKRGGRHTALSNAVFDSSLRAGNPDWGVRDLDDVRTLAGRVGLALVETHAMPADNLMLAFARMAPV